MHEHGESKRKQGPVTVLTLLFGLLLGFAGGGPQLQSDPGTARFGNGEVFRTANLRVVSRDGEDSSDNESAPALLPPPPRVVTELVSIRPAVPAAQPVPTAAALDPDVPYQARAPPAA